MGEAQQVLGWSERNQKWLSSQLEALGARIEAFAATPTSATEVNVPIGGPAIVRPPCEDDFTPALDRCADIFGLSPFERELLLLAAGVELDSGLRRLVAQAQATLPDGGRSSQPTFLLALRILAHPHWDALSPLAPLRRWRLIEMEARRSPAQQPLHIDERILHYLTGVAAMDERLRGVARFEAVPSPGVPSALAQRIARGLSRTNDRAALVVLTQSRPDTNRCAVPPWRGFERAAQRKFWLHARDLPADPRELAETALLVDREAALAGAVVLIEIDPAIDNPAESEQRAFAFIARLLGPLLLLGTPDPGRLARLADRRIAKIAVPDLPAQAVEAKIRQQLPAGAGEAFVGALQQFRLSPTALQHLIEQVSLDEAAEGTRDQTLARRIWQCCRESARGGLDALAQRVDSRACFDDVVLPPVQMTMLCDIAEHLRHRHTVYDAWGMAGKSARGRGLCALFTGESGTGKTIAAEVHRQRARPRSLPHRSAAVVSKYIGETEKNLEPRCSTPPKRAARSCCSTRPTLSSASAVRSRTATTATPISRSATCCSASRPIAASRSSRPISRARSTAPFCAGCASSCSSRSRHAARSRSGGAASDTAPQRDVDYTAAWRGSAHRWKHPQRRLERRLHGGGRQRAGHHAASAAGGAARSREARAPARGSKPTELRMSRVEVRIRSLVVHGFRFFAADTFSAALRGELEQRIALLAGEAISPAASALPPAVPSRLTKRGRATIASRS